jgi:hypothetical protein
MNALDLRIKAQPSLPMTMCRKRDFRNPILSGSSAVYLTRIDIRNSEQQTAMSKRKAGVIAKVAASGCTLRKDKG